MILINCLQDPDNDSNNELLAGMALNYRTDCIYCTDTQANNGNCSCYADITIGSCQGVAAGGGKSNSYLISCSDLITTGTWIEQGGAFNCDSNGCPSEAYRSAFTSDGL